MASTPRPSVESPVSDPSPFTERLCIASFNLNNLASPRVPVLTNKVEMSPEDYEKKIAWTADQLRRMNADVVGVQEVIHEKALREAVVRSGVYADAHVVVARENGVYPTVGLISRVPVVGVETFVDFPARAQLDFDGTVVPITAWTRPVLKAELELQYGQRLAVFVTHLKSMRPDVRLDRGDEHDFLERAVGKARSTVRRTAEALALRVLLLPFLKEKSCPVVVMGDLNDQMGSTTTEIITGTPPWRSLPVRKKLDVLEVWLQDVTELISRRSERHVYYTHIHNGRFECLDHIMVSQAFWSREPGAVGTVDYVRFFTDHLLDETVTTDKMPFWQSDHGQIMAILRIYNSHLTTPAAQRARSRSPAVGKRHQRLVVDDTLLP